MPELPEVETMRRGIAPVVGSCVRDVWRPRSRLRPIRIAPRFGTLRRRLIGRSIAGVGRAGKRVVVELDAGERLVFEPRMTGLVMLRQTPDANYLRLALELSGGAAAPLLFWDRRGLGEVHLLSPAQFRTRLGPDKLGPDALLVTSATLRDRLSPGRRAIKVALLDQRAVAGIGNLYASEILHRARVHPELPCSRLRPGQWSRLHAAMLEVLREAIDLEGSTLADGTYLTPQKQPGGYQSRHRVYQRAGQTCTQCGRARVVRLVQAQRSTFFCPRCQRPARR